MYSELKIKTQFLDLYDPLTKFKYKFENFVELAVVR